MIIDFHTHIFPDSIAERAITNLATNVANLKENEKLYAYTKGTASSLLESANKSGVDICITLPVATKPTQSRTLVDNAIRFNEGFEERLKAKQPGENLLYHFAGLHPENDDYKELINDLANHGVKGIKLHPVFQKVDFDDIRYKRIVEYATEKDLIVVVHSGYDITWIDAEYSTCKHILPVLKDVGPNKLVLAHMGGWMEWDIIGEMLSKYHPYIDTAFSLFEGELPINNVTPLAPERFKELVKLVGADHVLFGTDSPWSGQTETMELVKAVTNDDEYKMILGDNAIKLLNI